MLNTHSERLLSKLCYITESNLFQWYFGRRLRSMPLDVAKAKYYEKHGLGRCECGGRGGDMKEDESQIEC